MPEGDTVWLTARRLHQALADRVLTQCEIRVPQLATLDLRGDTVVEVVSNGKHVLTRLDSGVTLHSHLRMDGSWYITRTGTQTGRSREHLIRAVLGNDEWTVCGYSIHDLRLIATADEHALLGHLGPDVLGAGWNADEAVRRLTQEPTRAIAEALLDQRNLAGVGNVYKNEVLFLERANPWTPVGRIGNLSPLIMTVRRLMLANREHSAQSSTGHRARDPQHWVYERNGQPCLRCRSLIRSAKQGVAPRERTTFWCPTCQPEL